MSRIEFRSQVLNDLKNLDKHERQRIALKLFELLEVNGALGDPLSGDLSGYKRIRINNLRLIYKFDSSNDALEVLAIGKREDLSVYRTATIRLFD